MICYTFIIFQRKPALKINSQKQQFFLAICTLCLTAALKDSIYTETKNYYDENGVKEGERDCIILSAIAALKCQTVNGHEFRNKLN